MKICIMTEGMRCGGAERTICYLSDYLANNGDTVSIISLSEGCSYDLNPNVRLYQYKGTIKNRLMSFLGKVSFVNKRLKEAECQILISFYSFCMDYILPTTKRRLYVVSTERTNPLKVSKNMFKKRIKAYNKSDIVLFQTERAMNCFPMSIKDKSFVWENAVGNKLAYSINGLLLEKERTITAVGRLDAGKNYEMLLSAFALFLKNNPDYTLQIFGDGPLKNDLFLFSKRLGISNFVAFQGVSSDALVSVARSQCYVLCSKFEGLPNALMEAMAVGTPCIATDCDFGPRELIKNGENGILIGVNDVDRLAEKMNLLVNDKNLSNHIATNARKILITNSIDRQCSILQDLLRKNYLNKKQVLR